MSPHYPAGFWRGGGIPAGPRVNTFVECGCCGGWHRTDFTGDCREDAERFAELPVGAVEVFADEAHEVDEWDAPTCLRWLAAHTSAPNHYAMRADDWAGEVARFAAYEGTDPDEWNDTATEELRAAVRAAWTNEEQGS